MLENFIYAKEKSLFEEKLNNGKVLDEAIVFIEDTKEIWNHGTYFDGSTFDPSNIELSILNIIDTTLTKTEAADTYQPIGDYATKSELPTKLSQLENDVPYALKSDVEVEVEAPNGVYAITADGKLIDYHTADSSCIGVAFISANQKVMIPKANATDGTNTTLYWGKNLYQKDVAGITETTDQSVAKADFGGKANTDAIIAAYSQHSVDMDSRDMCKVLSTYAEGGFTDWYIPAAGQLYEMHTKMSDINTALQNIGGTALESKYYWSSSEYDASYAWFVDFLNGGVNLSYSKNSYYRVRFVRDLTTIKKPLKEKVSELESNKADKILVIDHDTNDVIFSLTPNVYHKWDTVTNLTLTLANAPEDIYNEYMFLFTSGDTATTLSVPNTILWVNQPNILSNKTYQCSIVNNIGVLVIV